MREALRVHDELVATGAFAAVVPDAPEERVWLDCDLASLAENRLGEVADPRSLDEARRADWVARTASERGDLRTTVRDSYERCYWILDGKERVGTLALATNTLGTKSLRMSSFYVLPHCRRKGIGRSAMRRLQQTLATDDLGMRLDTAWTWQRTVRFYVDIGLWVYMWKRDLTLCSYPGMPPPQLTIGEHEASLAVPIAGGSLTLASARRTGDTLEIDEVIDDSLRKTEGVGVAPWLAMSTLSLSMALHGWPLVRSQEHYDRCGFADGGPPEALANRIATWEAWDRKHGWLVDTPRIPGLEYPTWDDLQAKWDAQRVAMEAEMKRQEPEG